MNGIKVHLSGPNNSTIFTDCCGCAISAHQEKCPRCGELVLGHDEISSHKRDVVRWDYAYGRQKYGNHAI